jgi:hypothetical protein
MPGHQQVERRQRRQHVTHIPDGEAQAGKTGRTRPCHRQQRRGQVDAGDGYVRPRPCQRDRGAAGAASDVDGAAGGGSMMRDGAIQHLRDAGKGALGPAIFGGPGVADATAPVVHSGHVTRSCRRTALKVSNTAPAGTMATRRSARPIGTPALVTPASEHMAEFSDGRDHPHRAQRNSVSQNLREASRSCRPLRRQSGGAGCGIHIIPEGISRCLCGNMAPSLRRGDERERQGNRLLQRFGKPSASHTPPAS